MTSPSKSKPNFLSRAKLISENKKPQFLSKAKLISAPEEQYISDEQVERDIERSQAMNTSRILEATFGLPGDLINFAGGLFGFDIGAPGSQKLQEFSEKATGGYTKPQNQLESNIGETMQDIALFALPGAKHYSIARNIGIPVMANLAKEGLKYSGTGEGKAAAGKLGTMVLLDLLSHRKGLGTAKEYASSLFQKADDAIPKGLSIKSTNLENSLNRLEKTLKMGGSQPDTVEALTKINEIRGKISENSKIDLKELVAFRPSINKWVDKFKGFEIGGLTDRLRKSAIHNLNEVKGEIIKAAEEYGAKYNPEYLNLSKSANEAYAAYAQSNKIANFIEKHATSKLKSTGAKILLGSLIAGGTGGMGAVLGATAGAAATSIGGGGYKLFKTILRSKSPTLRNHYFQIIEGAAKGNAPQVVKNAKALDKQLLDMDLTGEINLEE